MSKKTFEFNAITKKFEVKCNMPDENHSTECPVVKIYRAGIENKLSSPVNEPNKIHVALAADVTPATAKIMFDIGQSVCNVCRFNETVCKKR